MIAVPGWRREPIPAVAAYLRRLNAGSIHENRRDDYGRHRGPQHHRFVGLRRANAYGNGYQDRSDQRHISIKDIPDGTVGANTGAATEEFKVQDGARLNVLHAGDRVTFAVSELTGTKTITKIEKK